MKKKLAIKSKQWLWFIGLYLMSLIVIGGASEMLHYLLMGK